MTMKKIIFKEKDRIVRLASKKEQHRIVERIKNSILSKNLRLILSPIYVIILTLTLSNVFASPTSKALLIGENNSQQRGNDQAEKVQQQQQQQQKAISSLQDELNSIVEQHEDDSTEANNLQLAKTIISRLMIDNLTGSNVLNSNNDNNVILNDDGELVDGQQIFSINEPYELNSNSHNSNNENQQSSSLVPNAYDALRLKKLFSMVQKYYDEPSKYAYSSQLPVLPNGELATMKRATARLGNYLHNQQRQSNGYPRNNFDFGLGKRPDGNVLRFGDSLTMGPIGGTNGGSSGLIQPVSQFGKRPSSHRYDFGLGKRVASPSYPRYDFGLGKRAPNRIRYDFGLGGEFYRLSLVDGPSIYHS